MRFSLRHVTASTPPVRAAEMSSTQRNCVTPAIWKRDARHLFLCEVELANRSPGDSRQLVPSTRTRDKGERYIAPMGRTPIAAFLACVVFVGGLLVLAGPVGAASHDIGHRWMGAPVAPPDGLHGGPDAHVTPLSSGYVETLNDLGQQMVNSGNVTLTSNTPTYVTVQMPLSGSPVPLAVNIELAPGQSVTAGQTYGTGYSGIVSVEPPIGCASDIGSDSANAEVDQVTYDSGSVASLAIQVSCTSPSGFFSSIYGAFAYNAVPTSPHQGYYTYESDGLITGYGNDSYLNYLGDLSAYPLNQPIVGMAQTSDGGGYWMVASDGGIFAYGDAGFYGSAGNLRLNKPIVGMAATPDGKGYWLVASDGGIFAYGDAGFYGSMGGMHLNQPIVGMAPNPTGGYWLVASDGGIFAFGNAPFYGSTGNIHLNRPVVGMDPTPDGKGYWFVASDGGIFAYGDAGFYGSTGNIQLNQPVVGMDATPSGNGYWLVASDGGIFGFNAPYYGSLPGDGVSVTDVAGLST